MKYVCVDELESAAGDIKKCVNQLADVKQQLHTHGTDAMEEMRNTVKYLWETFENILLYLFEFGDDELLMTAKKLYSAVKQYDYLGSTDCTGLCNALNAFANLLPKNETVNAQRLAHLMNLADYGFYPTAPDHVKMIQKAICFPATEINILDPCCGEGTALAELAQGENAVTYGVGLAENRADRATDILNEVAYGSFFRCDISSDAFHCVFLNPPYISQLNEYGFRQRMERYFLSQSLPLLMKGGLLIYIIPYYRATKEVCTALCSALDNIRVYRFLDAEFKKFHQVVFLGTKCTNKDEKMAVLETDRLIQLLVCPDHIPLITELPEKCYSLPDSALTVKRFQGSVINQAEISKLLNGSDSITCLFDNRTLETREQRPLLPLRLGHIGLIGGSGLMNGLVECETPHVIKGKVVKTSKTEIIDTKTETTVRTVNSNKMIFYILTPDGLKELS